MLIILIQEEECKSFCVKIVRIFNGTASMGSFTGGWTSAAVILIIRNLFRRHCSQGRTRRIDTGAILSGVTHRP